MKPVLLAKTRRFSVTAFLSIFALTACQVELDEADIISESPEGEGFGGSEDSVEREVPSRTVGVDSSLSVNLIDEVGTFSSFSSGQGTNSRPRCVFDQTAGVLQLSGNAGEYSQLTFAALIMTDTADITAEFSALLQPTEFKLSLREASSDSLLAYDSQLSISSFCSVALAQKKSFIQGTIACRDLLLQDAFGEPAGQSATIELRCPVEKVEETLSGSGGTSSSGGAPSTGGASSGGSNSGSGKCEGVAYPCSLLTDSECSSVAGCSVGGDCSGSTRLCSYQSYSFQCYAVDGCSWSSYSSKCTGYARSCSSYTGSSSCVLQEGCNWSKDCEGVSTSCSLNLSEFSCESQPGCNWAD